MVPVSLRHMVVSYVGSRCVRLPSALQDLLQACGSTSPFADRSWVGVTQWDDGTCHRVSLRQRVIAEPVVSWMTKAGFEAWLLARLFAPQAMVGPAGYVMWRECTGGRLKAWSFQFLRLVKVQRHATEDATSSNSFNLGMSENMRPQDPWGYHRFPCKNCGWISHFQVPHPHGGFRKMRVPPNHPSKIRIHMDVRILPSVHHQIWWFPH